MSQVLLSYYRGWRTIPLDRTGPFCDADLGHDCNGRDVDGGYNGRRYRSDEEVAAFLTDLARLAETYPNSSLPLCNAVYAAVKYEEWGVAIPLVDPLCHGW